ncbi:MAG TPA: hypothetical protein H9717_09905, partial [Candidatus Eisenbergiella merdipullorum]|nr:hypothetical protein [Candidatus Eisenbergiella merdipullorum]
MCFYLRNWQVTFLLYTLGVFISEYIAKAPMEPRDYRVVFLIQKKPIGSFEPIGFPYHHHAFIHRVFRPVRSGAHS